MRNILVIDTGSSSMRAVMFAENGKILFKEQYKYFMDINGDIAEQDPNDFLFSLKRLCKAAALYANSNNYSIDAISLTSQRSSVIPVKADGSPLCRAIMWYDKRAKFICEAFNAEHGEESYKICGMRATPILSAPKIAWIRDNKQDIYDRSFKMVGIHDFLIFHLTGRFVTDYTLASRTCLLDVKNLCWSDRLLELFNIDIKKLCELIPTGSIVGDLLPSFAEETGLCKGISIITGGGDQQCSVLGQGLLKPGQTGITTGTGAYIVTLLDKPVFDPKQRVNLNVAVQPKRWVLEASTLSAGSVFNWFNQSFYPLENQSYPFELIDDEIASTSAGANGVIMLPDLAGKGCPDWDNYAHGTFYNIGFNNTRADFARAMLEGIAAEIAECSLILKDLCNDFSNVYSTGGLAKSNIFNQIISDMIDFPVEKCKIEDTTAIGAFIAAAYTMGVYSSYEDAFESITALNKENFIPNSKQHEFYKKMNAARKELEQALPNRKICSIINHLFEGNSHEEQ